MAPRQDESWWLECRLQESQVRLPLSACLGACLSMFPLSTVNCGPSGWAGASSPLQCPPHIMTTAAPIKLALGPSPLRICVEKTTEFRKPWGQVRRARRHDILPSYLKLALKDQCPLSTLEKDGRPCEPTTIRTHPPSVKGPPNRQLAVGRR